MHRSKMIHKMLRNMKKSLSEELGSLIKKDFSTQKLS